GSAAAPGGGCSAAAPGGGSAAAARGGMDERRLTAWLITHGVLGADQVKQLLEEQIRLQRQGSALDVLGVGRKMNLLTDAQVVEVIEETGYRPVETARQGLGRPADPTDIGALESSPERQGTALESAEIPVVSVGASGGAPPPADGRRSS